jgi:uncharacterized protein (TIGR03118 family)
MSSVAELQKINGGKTVKILHRLLALAVFISTTALSVMAADPGRGFVETDLVANVATLTDANGVVHQAAHVDPNLVNPWGVGENAASPFWVSDNNAGKSTLYITDGTPQSLVVSIPAPGDPTGSSGTPTGLVFNIAGGLGAFKISGVSATGAPITAPATFLFSTEDGTILGWNPAVNPPGIQPTVPSTHAIIAVDNSANPSAEQGAVYKGLAITNVNGVARLYATNFRSGTIEEFGGDFKPDPTLASNAFTDSSLPDGYAPFNIVSLGDRMFVTYAIQDDQKHDDVAGESHGIVNTFDVTGGSQQRFAQHGQLNSPWGVAVAPASFGDIAGDILIGNFGNGHINIFDLGTGEFIGKLRDPQNKAIVIDGLWTLRVGNGGRGGDANKIYFTAGPNGESDGLFGSISPQ